MKGTTDAARAAVPPEEVERRIAEYRRLGFQRRAPAQVVYQGASVACPWPDCTMRIAGIHFQLERMGDPDVQARLLASWWNGPGLIGRCPGCGRPVLFGLTHKQAVTDLSATGATVLPDDWHDKAHVVTKSE